MSRLAELRDRAAAFWNEPRLRRRVLGVLGIVLALLCLFPQPYVARAKVLPQDASSIGLSSTIGAVGAQVQSLASLIGGGRQPIDMYLAIGRSTEVTDDVVGRLKLVGAGGYSSIEAARRALDRKVDVHSLTGGIIEIEVRTRDAREAERVTQGYVHAISKRIIVIGRDRVARKRNIVLDRFREAAGRLATAEARLNEFRQRNRVALPEVELTAGLTLRAQTEAQLQAKLVELEMTRQFSGPENPRFLALQSQVRELRAQLERTTRPAEGAAGPNVAGLTAVSTEYLNLYRDFRFAQALYDVYARSSEEVAVETLTGDTASDVQVIEAPRLDVDRKFNIPAVALLALTVLAAFFIEIYAPATGINLRLRRRTGQEP
ncbi:MAG: capsule biosynthesis protein [Sphingomonadales bacterium]|nr:capsule biosynthesis protein [Sphingomonadales bacterium]